MTVIASPLFVEQSLCMAFLYVMKKAKHSLRIIELQHFIVQDTIASFVKDEKAGNSCHGF